MQKNTTLQTTMPMQELHREELKRIDGGGWFKDAVYALQDWFGAVGSESNEVAAGTRG